MQHLTADWILTPNGLQQNMVLRVTEDGVVDSLVSREESGIEPRYLKGILCPGFVNAHCHLELSYLAGKIPRHTGMVGFFMQLGALAKSFSEEEISKAIAPALENMWSNGIVAIGDICTNEAAVEVKKQEHDMLFRNFIELLDPVAENAHTVIENGIQRAALFGSPSISPHSPYSVSLPLREAIHQETQKHSEPISIHFLESKAECEFFNSNTGPLADLYTQLGLGHVEPGAGSPLNWVREKFENIPQAVLLVHNVEISPEEIRLLKDAEQEYYFVLCPKANQYIHNTLPAAPAFAEIAAECTAIGTDSLAGNDALDILAEIKVLQSQYPELATEMLLHWATINGAKALGFDDRVGSFEQGKKPGVLQIIGVGKDAELDAESEVTRLF